VGAITNTQKNFRNGFESGCGYLQPTSSKIRKHPEKHKRQQTAENQKNTKNKNVSKWGPVFTFNFSRRASSLYLPVSHETCTKNYVLEVYRVSGCCHSRMMTAAVRHKPTKPVFAVWHFLKC